VSDVTVGGRQCRADLFDVRYTDFIRDSITDFAVGENSGTQYRVTCGATTTTCLLDQTLEACIATILRESAGGGGSGYTPPG
jgi:hypothetical protein